MVIFHILTDEPPVDGIAEGRAGSKKIKGVGLGRQIFDISPPAQGNDKENDPKVSGINVVVIRHTPT